MSRLYPTARLVGMIARKVLRPERCMVRNGKPCKACTEDIKLEKKIKELEIKIKKIYIKRRALRTAMNENHDSLIHKFPPEIASLIFIQCSPPIESIDIHFRPNPLYLGAVCQKWRQLAWATPELWTSLNIRSFSRDRAQLVREWLDRSASLPLDIKLLDDGDCDDQGQHDEVINILNKHSARWHNMHLNLWAEHLRCLSGSSQENILRRLALCLTYSLGRPKFSTFSMKSKPSPTDLTLRRVGLPYVDIVWNNLTTASVDDIGVDECFELIRRAPLLGTLKLHAINPSSDIFPIPTTRIVCPHLHSLELWEIKEQTVVAGILDSLFLPSLERWIHYLSSIPLHSIISFVGYLSSCLKIFKIGIDKCDYRQIPGLLSHLPSLEFLELRSVKKQPPTAELISLLCASAQYPLYLPHLQSLELVSEFYFAWESLPQIFALLRWRTLRVRVHTGVERFDDRKTRKELLELVDTGIDLSIINLHWRYNLLQEEPRLMHRSSSTFFT